MPNYIAGYANKLGLGRSRQEVNACRFPVKTGRIRGWSPLWARGLRDCEHRLAADRFGGEAGRLHIEFGLGEPVELRSQPRLAPQRELSSEIVLLFEKDRRAGGAQDFLDADASCRPSGERVQSVQMAQQCSNYRDR